MPSNLRDIVSVLNNYIKSDHKDQFSDIFHSSEIIVSPNCKDITTDWFFVDRREKVTSKEGTITSTTNYFSFFNFNRKSNWHIDFTVSIKCTWFVQRIISLGTKSKNICTNSRYIVATLLSSETGGHFVLSQKSNQIAFFQFFCNNVVITANRYTKIHPVTERH